MKNKKGIIALALMLPASLTITSLHAKEALSSQEDSASGSVIYFDYIQEENNKNVESFEKDSRPVINRTYQWTPWLDRDDDSGTGDWELRVDFPAGVVCDSPVGIEARTVSTRIPYYQTGETLTVNPNTGLICENRLQADGDCSDYEVRFLCPLPGWTDWLDRDNPSGTGDWETRADFPAGSVCANPTAIEARVVNSHTPWYLTGETLQVDPQTGLICRDDAQRDGKCKNDYEVRFYCP